MRRRLLLFDRRPLLQNGDFESDFSGWYTPNAVNGALDGTRSLSVVAGRLRVTADGTTFSRYGSQKLSGLQVGRTYRVTGIQNRRTQSASTVAIRELLASGATLGTTGSNFATGDVVVDFTFVASQPTAYFNCFGSADTDTLYAEFDHLSVRLSG